MQRILAWLLAWLISCSGAGSQDVTAQFLVSNGVGVDTIESWTLNINTVVYFEDGSWTTDYLFEQSPGMWHMEEYPQMAVADGDYDKYYDIDAGVLYSTGVGGFFSENREDYHNRFENLISLDILELLENPIILDDPETLKRYDCYVVSGVTNHPIVDDLSQNMLRGGADCVVNLAYDTSTLVLRYMQFMMSNGERSLEVSIEISNVNSTNVELPLDPATIRHAN